MTSKSDRSSTSADRTGADQTAPDRAGADRVIGEVYRSDWGRLLSLLVARTRRLDLAEEALGEAFVRAAERWRADGVPTNPVGWLYTAANRLIVGGLRAEAMRGRKAPLLAVRTDWTERTTGQDSDLGDDRLALILLCSHPALRPEARSALALRLVIGTPTQEIARLFLVSPTTMAARITRAKKKIVTAGIPLSQPIDEELRSRLGDVCRTIYLAFTAGYTPGQGPDLLRKDLAGEAVELAAIVHRLVPEDTQIQALRSLLLLHHARRDARERNGRLMTLGDQHRSRWRGDEVRVGLELAAGLEPTEGYAEELRLQVLIAAEHMRASVASDTDWSTIAMIYEDLESLTHSPVVTLNRAVAVAEADGPAAGLALLDGLGSRLDSNHRFHAVRADLAHRAGRSELARKAYGEALQRCANPVEREHLEARLERLSVD